MSLNYTMKLLLTNESFMDHNILSRCLFTTRQQEALCQKNKLVALFLLGVRHDSDCRESFRNLVKNKVGAFCCTTSRGQCCAAEWKHCTAMRLTLPFINKCDSESPHLEGKACRLTGALRNSKSPIDRKRVRPGANDPVYFP